MKVCVFGLGYVGCVSIACLAEEGHDVTGVDISDAKNALINQGAPTIIEKDIDSLLMRGWDAGRVRATSDHAEAIAGADLSLICVGTPNTRAGHLDMTFVHAVATNIGEGLRDRDGFHVVAIRSTVMPGTADSVAEIIAEASGKKRGEDFEVVAHPEFLREGTAIEDFLNPALTVIGTDSERAFEVVSSLYKNIDAPIHQVDVGVAETIKFVNNSFHALKVTFANEVGNICKKLGVDSHQVMDLVCADTKLNISPVYLKPGFAYGGSCLPKDLKSLRMIAHDHYLEIPVIGAIERSNDYQKQILVDWITGLGDRDIGILGFSFKPGTDDLRNSPIVQVAETLIGKGFRLRIYDKNVHVSRLTGKNKEYIEATIPHLEQLISDRLEDVVKWCDVIVIANREEEFVNLPALYPDKTFIDLVRVLDEAPPQNGRYHGFSW